MITQSQFKKPFYHSSENIQKILYRLYFPKQFKFLLKKLILGDNGNSLKGFLETGILFVHIPKCAGISLNYSLYGNKGGGHVSALEYKLFFSKKTFSRLFKFAVVRNPWERTFSAYQFLKKGGRNKWDQEFANKSINKYIDFENFVLNWVDHKNIYTGIHFIPQYEFVCDLKNKIIVDEIIKLENLDEYYSQKVLKRSKILISPEVVHKNETHTYNSASYLNFYTKEMIAHIEEVYKKDIQLFDFEFKSPQ